MNDMQTSMRVPCNRCGQLNTVERAAEATFRCSACGASNTVRTLASNGPVQSPAVEPHRAARRWQPALTPRATGRPAGEAPRSRTGAFGRAKQVLVALMVVSVGAAFANNGTFATFNATTTNAATITSGTLLLGDKVATGTECFSAGQGSPTQTIGSGNSANCTSVWNATVSPGATNTTGTSYEVAVRNVGNINATTFQLYASAGNTCDSAPGFNDATSGVTFKGANQAVSTTQSGATSIGATSTTVASATGLAIGDVIQVDTGANYEQLTISNIVGNVLTTNATTKNHANGVAVNGGGLCRETQLVVAKTNSSFNALTTCEYGNTSSGTSPFTGCAYDSTHNLRDFNDNYPTGGSNPGPISLGAFNSGTTQYFVIDVLFPSGADNSYQGLGASVNFTWFAQQ